MKKAIFVFALMVVSAGAVAAASVVSKSKSKAQIVPCTDCACPFCVAECYL